MSLLGPSAILECSHGVIIRLNGAIKRYMIRSIPWQYGPKSTLLVLSLSREGGLWASKARGQKAWARTSICLRVCADSSLQMAEKSRIPVGMKNGWVRTVCHGLWSLQQGSTSERKMTRRRGSYTIACFCADGTASFFEQARI